MEYVKNKPKSPLSFVNSQIIDEIGWAAQMRSAKVYIAIKNVVDAAEARDMLP